MLLEASYTVAVSHIFLAPLCLPDPVVLDLDCLLLAPAVPSLLVYGSVGPFRDIKPSLSWLGSDPICTGSGLALSAKSKGGTEEQSE